MNLKIVCRENYKYEVQEKSPANQAVTMQQLAEEYWRSLLDTSHYHCNMASYQPTCLRISYHPSFILVTGHCHVELETKVHPKVHNHGEGLY